MFGTGGSATAKGFSGRKALSMIENKGQVTDQNGHVRQDIDFKIAGAGLNVFLGKGSLHYQWIKDIQVHSKDNGIHHQAASPAPIELYRMDVQLVGANPDAILTKEEPAAYSEHDYVPSIGQDGVVAHAYQRVTYHDIYPNIDWVFYFKAGGQLEHDFIVRPGGKVSDIKIEYQGATGLNINADGSLTAITTLGMVQEKPPYAYEPLSGEVIPTTFQLNQNALTFSASPHEGTLVIDPTLQWGTYFGGNDVDYISDVVIGKDGMVYVTGATNSAANIVTTGAYQSTYGGGSAYFGNDAFISKFNPDGTCIWSTYYGTADEDAAKSISKDTSGNLYIAGYTFSTSGLASTGALHPASGGSYDAFIAKFDTSGERIWGTYFGGEGDDGWGPIALHGDRFGNIYLTGQTTSATGISTSGAYQSSLFAGLGDQDAFLAKFNSSGSLIWSTYYGGNFGDGAYAVTNDSSGNIYITGNTNSTTGISTTGQMANNGGYDAFVAKFDPSGNKTWSTYWGGNLDDYGLGIACDDSANVYLTGATLSTSNLTTPNAFQVSYGGGYQDGMLGKLSSAGDLLWSTYYGGTSEDEGDKIIVAPNGGVYISGYTGSNTGMVSAGAIQSQLGGSYDGLIARFSQSGAMLWGSYIGGVDAEEAYSIAADALGNLYVGGNTMSATGIASGVSWQGVYGGGDYDGFLWRIKDCTAPLAPDSILGLTNVCAGSVETYHAIGSANATSYNWIFPALWTGNSDTTGIAVTFGSNSGLLKVAAVNDCAISDTIAFSITVNPLPELPQIVQNGNALATVQNYTAYQWLQNGQPINGATSSSYIPSVAGNYAVIVYNAAGCSDTSSVFGYGTGISKVLQNNGISVFPNPAADLVFVTTTQKVWLMLYSVDGKLLKTKELFAGTSQLRLDGIAKGFYAIRFTALNGNYLGVQELVKTAE